MTANTIERARHRWREILPQLGIDTRFLHNKHGPCPICGGKDRYRFDDRDGTGSYYCGQCGPGYGIILIRKLHKWDHATACREVDKIIGNGNAGTTTKTAATDPAIDPAKKRADIERILRAADDLSVATEYLRRRGLSVTSDVLKGHPRCPYFDKGSQKLIGTFRAVIAPIIGPDGTLRTVQQIYDADLNPRKKYMPKIDTIVGGAVRLHPAGDELGIAEGVETALATHQLFRLPVWSALSEGGIKSFQPPGGTLRLHIFADNDSNYVGQEAAYNLARSATRDGLKVEVHIPPDTDTDWLDVLNGARR